MKFNFKNIFNFSSINNQDFDLSLLRAKPQLDGKKFSIVDFYYNFFQPSDYFHAYVGDEKAGRSCTYYWDSFDSFEKFEKNIQLNKDLKYYLDHPIEYSINKLAHRNFKELEQFDDTIDLCLGDSYTFGVGLHREHIWTSLLEKDNDIEVYNGALPGSGILTWYRTLRYISSKKTIRNLYILIPIGFARYEYYDPAVNNYKELNVYIPTFEKEEGLWPLMAEENISFMFAMGIDAVEGFCNRNNINFYFVTSKDIMMEKDLEGSYKEKNIPARDNRHFDTHYHLKILDIFKKKVGKLA